MMPIPILQWLKEKLAVPAASVQCTAVGGGSINDTYRVKAGKDSFFCKINQLSTYPSLFACEQKGLALLAQQQVIRIPRVLALGEVGGCQVLLLEWIEQGLRTDAFWKKFGEQLAALHRVQNDTCGLPWDNYMGALPQYNRETMLFTDFFIHQRLEPQVKLAMQEGLLLTAQTRQFEKLYQKLPDIFAPEPACLLHGDLWSGNFLCDDSSQPVLIDPAVYYGNRNVDLAMTTLFGGFDALFYESYCYHYPLSPNYREQWEVCNLYPLLIHLNLFGKGYLHEVLGTLNRYG